MFRPNGEVVVESVEVAEQVDEPVRPRWGTILLAMAMQRVSGPLVSTTHMLFVGTEVVMPLASRWASAHGMLPAVLSVWNRERSGPSLFDIDDLGICRSG